MLKVRRREKGGNALKCKDRLEEHLRKNKVAFQVQHHPLAYTAQEIAASEHVPGKMLAKVVMVRRVDLEKAHQVLGSKETRGLRGGHHAPVRQPL